MLFLFSLKILFRNLEFLTFLLARLNEQLRKYRVIPNYSDSLKLLKMCSQLLKKFQSFEFFVEMRLRLRNALGVCILMEEGLQSIVL